MLDIVLEIVGLIEKAHTQVQLANANKEQCRLLGQRLSQLQLILPTSETEIARIQGQRFTPALNDCLQTTQDCLTQISRYDKNEKWYKRVVRAGNDSDTFAKLNRQIDQSQLLLATSLAMHNAFAQQDQQAWQQQVALAQKQDQADLKKHIKEVEQLQRIQIVNNISAALPQAEQTHLIQAQMQAVHGQLYQHSEHPAYKDPADSVDAKLRLDLDDLVYNDIIAKGSFGSVYGGRWQGQTVAIKTINTLNEANRHKLIREVQIMGRLQHPHIPRFYGACLDAGFECLVMQRMHQGTLSDYLAIKTLTFSEKQTLITDLLSALAYLHNYRDKNGQGMVHRDLKAGNILMDQDRAFISDFGLAQIKHSQSVQMHAILPTPEVSCAPELLQRKEVTGKADIYSVGWLLWHILTQQPWPAPGQPQPALDSLHPSYQALIQACWQEDPSQRPDAKSLLKGCQAIALLTPEAQEQLFTQGQALEAQSDYPGAKAAFAQAASQGHAKAAYSLGMLYANRKIPLAPQAMLRALTQAADANYYRAQYNLARVYEKGELIEKDPKKAIALYQKAANNPNTPDDMRTFAQGKIQSLQTSSGLDMAETNTSAARPGFN